MSLFVLVWPGPSSPEPLGLRKLGLRDELAIIRPIRQTNGGKYFFVGHRNRRLWPGHLNKIHRLDGLRLLHMQAHPAPRALLRPNPP